MSHALVGGTEDAFREKWVDWVEPEPQPEPSLAEDLPHQSPAKQWKAGLAGPGPFDLALYNGSYGLNLADEQEGLDHYLHRGAAEGKRPEFLWIAEADDLSDPSFLTSLLDLMRGDRPSSWASPTAGP